MHEKDQQSHVLFLKYPLKQIEQNSIFLLTTEKQKVYKRRTKTTEKKFWEGIWYLSWICYCTSKKHKNAKANSCLQHKNRKEVELKFDANRDGAFCDPQNQSSRCHKTFRNLYEKLELYKSNFRKIFPEDLSGICPCARMWHRSMPHLHP